MLKLRYCLVGMMLISSQVSAKNLFETLSGQDINEFDWLKKYSITMGGWLSMGATLNTDDANQHNNAPVTFNDRLNEFQLNQFNLFVQKTVDLEAKSFDFGGRLEAMFGTDSRFTQATGLDDKVMSNNALGFYDLAIPQAYVELFAPIGNGLTAKIGHFYTIMGQEVVMAPNNFFYSHAYIMQYGEPFTHTGVLFNYALNDNFTLNIGSVNGWDNFDQNLSQWSFLGGVSWANDQATSSIAWSVISGDSKDRISANKTLSSLVISHSFTDKLRYIFQHDVGFEENATQQNTTAYWYGVNQYLFYDLSTNLSLALRGEWFRDNNGTRLGIGRLGDYFELTAGVNWQAMPWLKFRPELRYDWTSTDIPLYNNQTQEQQLRIGMDVVVLF